MMTFKEYLMDYASPRTLEVGERLLAQLLAETEKPETRRILRSVSKESNRANGISSYERPLPSRRLGHKKPMTLTSKTEECLERLQEAGPPRREDLIALLSLRDEKALQPLFFAADARRKETVGDVVHLRGIVEFSNYCERNCLYCGCGRQTGS
jgi:hypothetical protein